jgi:hypothetical protein
MQPLPKQQRRYSELEARTFIARFRDAEWHSLEDIYEQADLDRQSVDDIFLRLSKSRLWNCTLEKKKVGNQTYQVRLSARTLRTQEVANELDPYIKALEKLANRHAAEYSRVKVAEAVHHLRVAYDKWREAFRKSATQTRSVRTNNGVPHRSVRDQASDT